MDMIRNDYLLDEGQYLFAQIDEEARAYCQQSAKHTPISLGIGDVRQPVAPCVVEAMRQAAGEMGNTTLFRGYAPAGGYAFVLDAIAAYYRSLGVQDSPIPFAGCGAKEELAIWSHVVSSSLPALLTDPCYPMYADSCRIVGRKIVWMEASDANDYLPIPCQAQPRQYLIYLCSPNNPTGACYSPMQLQKWVDFALETHSLILFDCAYRLFADRPYSIFLCRGAQRCCVEIGTLSKSCSFSGLRFGWSAIGNQVQEEVVHAYSKYKCAMCNGVSYPIQRAAQAALSQEGVSHAIHNVATYKNTAAILSQQLESLGCRCQTGAYIWCKMPYSDSGMGYVRRFLRHGLVITPGDGFGRMGKNHVRLSVFGIGDKIKEVQRRLQSVFSE